MRKTDFCRAAMRAHEVVAITGVAWVLVAMIAGAGGSGFLIAGCGVAAYGLCAREFFYEVGNDNDS